METVKCLLLHLACKYSVSIAFSSLPQERGGSSCLLKWWGLPLHVQNLDQGALDTSQHCPVILRRGPDLLTLDAEY